MDTDLSSLRLNGATQSVLDHLLRHREMSVSALGSVAGMAPSVVSRALRTLRERGLVEVREGRSAPASLAPGAGASLRAEAAQLRGSAVRRAAEIDRVAELLERVAPDAVDHLSRYWLVPLSADGPDLESGVRRVASRFDACVSRGGRARGVPARAHPSVEVTWRLLVTAAEQVPAWTPPRTRLEARRIDVDPPFLELLDGTACCLDVLVAGRLRRVWCREASQVALAAAGFEQWWAQAEPVAGPGQSTRAAQPLDRATAARQRR